MTDLPEVFTTGQVTVILGMSTRTINKMVDEGHLEGFRIPDSLHRRVTRKAVEQFLTEHGMSLNRLHWT